MYMCYIGVDIVPTTFNRDCTNKELKCCSFAAYVPRWSWMGGRLLVDEFASRWNL